MDIVVEPRTNLQHWKLWVVNQKEGDKIHIGTVAFSQGETILHATVKEIQERWGDEMQNMLHNTKVIQEHFMVYSEQDIPYIHLQYQTDSEDITK